MNRARVGARVLTRSLTLATFTLTACPHPTTPHDAAVLATDVPRVSPLAPYTRNGRHGGYIRFVHVASHAGPVRFVADNAPMYEHSHVESGVVAPGSASGYLPTVSVSHRVRVLPADSPADASVSLTATFTTDVYNDNGCTVVLYDARTDAGATLALQRVTDVPRRAGRGDALVRFAPMVADAPALTLRDGDTVLYTSLPALEITGLKRLVPGVHTFAIGLAGDGGAAGGTVQVRLPDGAGARTVWLWHGAGGGSGVAGLVTEDVPGG